MPTPASQRVHSTCPHDCPSTCALEVEKLDERTIGRVYGAKAMDYTDGVICAKVARYAERIHHPDRLMHPLIRTGPKGVGHDAFERIGWDEALDIVADRFSRAAARDGAESVWPYYYAGAMGLLQRYAIERLANVMGYSRQHVTFCVSLPNAGWYAGVGTKRGVDSREMSESDVIVVWGGNPVNTQVNVMHHISRARRERGAKLVVVDAYRTGTVEKADLPLLVRPGTDGALALAVMHVLLEEGLADRDYLASHTDFSREFEDHLAARTPEWAENITGVPANRIREFGRLYGSSKRAFIRVGYGFARSRNGAVNMHAVSCLPAMTGAWQVRGGGAMYGQTDLYPVDYTLIKGLDTLDPGVRILDQSRIGRILTGDRDDIGDGPPVNAMIMQSTNPAMVAPESARVREGLSREDLFLCVHEQFMTETAEMADIVLPATMFLEYDDLYIASGHTFLQLARTAIETPGECRSNHRVSNDLAARLGAEHPAFSMSERELISATLERSGLPGFDALSESHWHDLAPEFDTAHFLDGFGHEDGRFHFRADWSKWGTNPSGMPAFPDHWTVIDAPSDDRPYRLVTAPAKGFLNSTFTETPGSRRAERRPELRIHPDDAGELGAGDGDLVRMGNRLGSLLLHVRLFDGVQRGVVIAESIHPNAAFIEGVGINLLISADAGQPDGGGVYHDTAVWIRPAEPDAARLNQ